jgi:hypothetical protein
MIWRSITLISCGIVGGWVGWMASERDVPVKYQSTATINSPKPGELLRIRHVVSRDKSCQTTVYRLIFDRDGDRFIVPDLEFAGGVLPLGADTFTVPVPISPEADPGPATYRVLRKYRCNWLHWIWPIMDGPYDYGFTVSPR